MTRNLILALALMGGLCTSANVQVADAGDPYGMTHVWNLNAAAQRPWHGGYQYQIYGQPTAVVAPPVAHMRQTYSWGVSQNLSYPIHHQFGRSANFPGAAGNGQFRHTPAWPSHTDQFGLYYVRGPWR